MMGHTHALAGAVAWLGLVPFLADYGMKMTPGEIVAGSVVCAGAALLPDMDHHSGSIANALGPVTKVLCKGVAAISGGHRHATHSLMFVLVTMFGSDLLAQHFRPGWWVELFLLICLGASMAAFASAGNNSLAAVGFAGIVLSMLNLPIEAALALFLAVDLICEGPRNLLTLLFACVLIVLVSRGLPSERIEITASADLKALEPVRFVFSRAGAAMALACVVLVAILITIAGIGVGMRTTEASPFRPYAMGSLPVDGNGSV